MILYVEKYPKDTARKLLELIIEFSKVEGYKIKTQKPLAFLYTKDQKEKLRKQSYFQLLRKENNTQEE